MQIAAKKKIYLTDKPIEANSKDYTSKNAEALGAKK